jgi:hypothetical protein
MVYAPPGLGGNEMGIALEHRAIMCAEHGRRLASDEVVHHINGNHGDNHKENLVVMNAREHLRLHARLRRDAQLADGTVLIRNSD